MGKQIKTDLYICSKSSNFSVHCLFHVFPGSLAPLCRRRSSWHPPWPPPPPPQPPPSRHRPRRPRGRLPRAASSSPPRPPAPTPSGSAPPAAGRLGQPRYSLPLGLRLASVGLAASEAQGDGGACIACLFLADVWRILQTWMGGNGGP